MRKRKKPVLLVTLLVVLVCTAAGINLYQSMGMRADAPEQPQSPVKNVGESRTPESQKSIAGAVKSSMKGHVAHAPDDEMGPGGPAGGRPADPTKTALIARPKAVGPGSSHVPKPSDSSIAGQWYQPEANHKTSDR